MNPVKPLSSLQIRVIYKVLVDSPSLECAKLEVICPIIVSAEFLKRAREKFSKATDRTLRATVIVSQLGLAGGPPPPSPKDFASRPGISTGLRPEQANQQTEEERVTAEIRRIFESKDLTAVERKVSSESFAWLTSTSRYLFLSVEQAMGLFREAFEKRQPQCLAFRVSGEGQNKKISVLMKDFGVLEWNGELSAASFVSLTPYRGSWFISSVGEFPRDTLENVQRNSTDLRPCPPRAPESQEQRLFSEVSVFGLSAEFTDKGNIVISSIDGKKREINLPPLVEFYLHFGGMQFSPDGTKLVVWRDSHDKGKEGYTIFLVSPQTGEFKPIFSDFVKSLNYLSRSIDLEWSQDSKKLRIASGHHGRGKGVIVDINTEQVLFEYRGGIYGRFSPDGNWFAGVEEKDLEVRRISDGYSFTVRNNGADFSWSPDSMLIAFHNCQRWIEQAFGPSCERAGPAIYDLASQRLERFNTLSLPSWKPEISPDGTKILFMFPGGAPRISQGFVFWNRQTGELPAVPVDVNQVDRFSWRYGFHTSKDLLFYGRGNDARVHVVWVDTETWVKIDQLIETGRGETAQIREVTQDLIIYEVFRVGGDRRDLYIAPINKTSTRIKGEKIAQSLIIAPQNGSEVLGWLKEGDIFTSGEKTFIFRDGRRHLIEKREAVDYFQGNRSALAEGLVPFVPESETKISFLPGDVIGNKDGLWYLRNGKRYKIQNWDWFKERQRSTKVPIPIDKGIIEMIPVGEVPPPEPGTRGIRDWDGKIKEHQPFGGRMFIFMGGFGSDSESQLEAFRVMKNFFMSKGVYDVRFLEPSYNLRVTREGTFPEKYASIDTYKHPLDSVKYMELEIQRYKEMFPMTKFILIGHSLGGFVLFNAAVAHADAVEAVIALDSPLVGVDRSLLSGLIETGDEIVARWAEVFNNSIVGRFLVEAGDNPAFREEAERKARYLISRGTKVITATNRDDILIPEWSAVLESSRTEAEKGGIQLVWDLGRGHLSFNLGELLFEAGHGQILTNDGIWESYIAGLSLP